MSTDDIKDIIKNRRIELNLTLLDVAKAVGVSEGTVSRWESGDIADMKRSRIAALAKVLKISPNVIMGWKEENDFKHLAPILRTDDEDMIDLINNIVTMSKEEHDFLHEIIDHTKDLDKEQQSKLIKLITLIKSNII